MITTALRIVDSPWLGQQIAYPGMNEAESKVVRAWLAKYAGEWDWIAFNVRLGEGQAPLPGLSAAVQLDQRLLTQKRADVIVEREGQHLILEAKWRAGFGVLGQLLGYRALFMRAYPLIPIPRVGVIAKYADLDVTSVLADHDIPLEIFDV